MTERMPRTADLIELVSDEARERIRREQARNYRGERHFERSPYRVASHELAIWEALTVREMDDGDSSEYQHQRALGRLLYRVQVAREYERSAARLLARRIDRRNAARRAS